MHNKTGVRMLTDIVTHINNRFPDIGMPTESAMHNLFSDTGDLIKYFSAHRYCYVQ